KLSLDEVTGSTFTTHNAGNIGGILATPVINWPEGAILGVHKIADRAVVRNGAIVVRKMMNLSGSIDHRVGDGATGARFMNELLQLLEDPRRLLLGSARRRTRRSEPRRGVATAPLDDRRRRRSRRGRRGR